MSNKSDIIYFVARQGLALRTEDPNDSNFKELLLMRAEDDPNLRRLGQGEILTQIGAGFGLRIMGIIIKKLNH